MKQAKTPWILLMICLAATAIVHTTIQAQPPFGRGGKDRHGERPPDADAGGLRVISSLQRFSAKLVKNAPFTATINSEFVQTLRDGSKISRQTTATIARDSEGRTRREQTFSGIGPLATTGEPLKMVFIHDPVLQVEYILNLKQRTVEKKSFPAGSRPHPEVPLEADAKTEVLEKRMIEGLEAEGTRNTITIPIGKIGNDRPLEIISEQWYAPLLQEIILSKHFDPRFGETIYRLTNINRAEPTATLFQAPTDFAPSGASFGRDGKHSRRPDEEEK